MPKGACIYCKAILDISDEIIECTYCKALMRVTGRNPFKLELLDSGANGTERLKSKKQLYLNKYNTGGRRFLASIVDIIVLRLISIINDWVFIPSRSLILIAIWLFISYSAVWVYSVLMHSHYGQTIGKMIFGVKVLDISERPMTMQQAISRDSVIIVISSIYLIIELYGVLEVLTGNEVDLYSLASSYQVIQFAETAWFVMEMLTLLTNKKKRALHDFLAGTVVVRYKSQYKDQVGV